MRWLQETDAWRENIGLLIAAIVGVIIIATIIVFAVLVFMLGQRDSSRSVAGVPTQFPIDPSRCYLTANNRTVTVYNRPRLQDATNVSLEVNQPYIVQVIAEGWYGLNWPDVAPGETGYSRYRWVFPDLTNVIFRGDCNPVTRTTVAAIFGQHSPQYGRVSVPVSQIESNLPAYYPDSDSDGTPDNIDACPYSYGGPYNRGCPTNVVVRLDVDGDGVPNTADACPNTAGVPELSGCPGENPRTMVGDNDGDGLDNEADACPDLYGPTFLNGCPGEDPSTMARDHDRDGVLDAEDWCPSVIGFVNNNGCP